MRWLSSEPPSALGRRPSALLAAAILLAGSACVTSSSRSFVPDGSRERFSLGEAQDALDQMVAAECPRLMGARRDLGEARITVDVDGSGQVTKSTLSKQFGDERMDQIFGGVAAQMRFDAPEDGTPKSGRMRVGYACSATARTATIELIGQKLEQP
jgi:hypothetical protein